MSVENNKVVDAISINSAGAVVLTISDHLEWTEEYKHLEVLQSKINAYLSFLEEKEIEESYPDVNGRSVIINIVFRFEPTEHGLDFLEKVGVLLRELGYEFTYATLT